MAATNLNFITSNPNKLLEVEAILGGAEVVLKSQRLALTEIQGSIEDITRDKCKRAAAAVKLPRSRLH